MLEPLRRWFGSGPDLPGWSPLAAWAKAQRWSMRRTIAHDGWVMSLPTNPDWRVEWGPSQRSFMSAHELRVRIEAPNIVEAQALVLDRPLLARMDHEVYQQFTDSVQTRYDDQLPEEMRWLAMHARLGTSELGPLRERYGALGHDAPWVSKWLSGEFAGALLRRAGKVPVDAASAEPLMVRLSFGKLVLRQAAENPTVEALETLLDVARAADEATRHMPPT
jgi:hypothetical protein